MNWETIRFGDLYAVDSRNGVSKPSRVRGSGYKMINMGELFSYDRIYDIPMELVPLSEKEKIASKVEEGDLLFARQSLVLEGAGKCSIVMEVSPLTVFESHIIRVRLRERCNPLFYYYFFKSDYSPVKSIVSQCAQAGIRASELKELMVPIPPLDIQNQISNILSAYDDLIETNRKQIILLEEAAQRLYAEWIIDFRFPENENVRFINGRPENWIELPIEDVFSIKYGKNLATSELINDAQYPVYGANGIIGYYNKCNVNDYVTLITSRGNGSGEVMRTYHKDSYVTNNSFIVMPRPNYEYMAMPFVYELMKTLNFKGIRSGSAQPQLTNTSIKNLKVIVPDKSLIVKLCKHLISYFENIVVLKNQINLAQEARDLLLPRLMSGELNIE